jgi:hypothetical protein
MSRGDLVYDVYSSICRPGLKPFVSGHRRDRSTKAYPVRTFLVFITPSIEQPNDFCWHRVFVTQYALVVSVRRTVRATA